MVMSAAHSREAGSWLGTWLWRRAAHVGRAGCSPSIWLGQLTAHQRKAGSWLSIWLEWRAAHDSRASYRPTIKLRLHAAREKTAITGRVRQQWCAISRCCGWRLKRCDGKGLKEALQNQALDAALGPVDLHSIGQPQVNPQGAATRYCRPQAASGLGAGSLACLTSAWPGAPGQRECITLRAHVRHCWVLSCGAAKLRRGKAHLRGRLAPARCPPRPSM